MKQEKTRGKGRKKQPIATHAPAKSKKNSKTSPPKQAEPLTHFKEEEERLTVRELFCAEGVAILEWTATFPAPATHGAPQKAKKGRARIAAFYRRMAEEADSYVRGGLLPALKKQYEADPDPRKRYRHARVRLGLHHTVTQDENGFFSARRQVTVSRGNKLLFSREEGDVFETKRGRLCPLIYLRRAGFPMAAEAKEKTAGGGFYLCDGEIRRARGESS